MSDQNGGRSFNYDDAEFRASVRGHVRSILRDKLPAEWNDESSYRDDLGLDSLDFVEMVARLEQVTGIFIPDEDVPKLTSISATAEYVSGRRQALSGELESPRLQDEVSL
jgi:acyl carrier protein